MQLRWIFLAISVFGVALAAYWIASAQDAAGEPSGPVDASRPPPLPARPDRSGHEPPAIAARPRLRVRGIVVGDREVPLVGALISAKDGEQQEVRTLTDAEGRFEIVGQGLRFESMAFSADGYAPKVRERVRATDSFFVRLSAGVPFDGRIMDARGSPLAAATVRMFPLGRPDSRSLLRTTDADGRFLVQRIAPGRWDVFIEHADAAPWMDAALVIPEVTGRSKDYRLLLALTLTVRVSDGAGTPIRGAEVFVTGPLSPERPLPFASTRGPLLTDGDGQVAIGSIPPGRLRLRARAPGRGGLEQEHHVQTDTSLILTIPESPRVEGTVVDPSGAPVADARVVMIPDLAIGREAFTETAALLFGTSAWTDAAGTRWPTVTADLYGRFTLRGLPLGADLFVEAHDPRQRHAQSDRVRVDTSGSETAGLRLRLSAGSLLVGQVVDPAGRPIDGATLSHGETWTRTDEDGRFELGPLPFGNRGVGVGHPSYRSQTVSVSVSDPPGAALILVLDPGTRVEGRVVDLADRPIANAFVQVRNPGGGLLRGVATDGEGRFSAGGLEAVRVAVAAFAEGYASQTQPDVDPSAGAITLHLSPVPYQAGGDLAAAVVDAATQTPLSIQEVVGVPPAQVRTVPGGVMVQNLPPGRHTIEFRARGFQPHAVADVRIGVGEMTTLPLLALHAAYPLEISIAVADTARLEETLIVTVVELDRQDNPPRFLVAERRSGSASSTRGLGRQGAVFDVPSLRRGRYRVDVRAGTSSSATTEVVVSPRNGTARISLQP